MSGRSTGAPVLICGDHSSDTGAASSSSPAPRGGNGLFEKVLVKFDPHFLDMARLLVAQKIARAADVEIVTGQRETRAKAVEGLHDVQALLRRRGRLSVRRQGQVGVAARLAAPDVRATDRAPRGRTCRPGG